MRVKAMRSISSSSGVIGILLVSLAIGATFQAAPNLILYWRCEDTAGPTATDSSGNALNGTWSGLTNLISVDTANFAPNTTGNTRSLLFTTPATLRTAGGFVRVNNTAATRFTGPFSMMAWIKPTTLVAGQNHVDMSGVIFNADYITATGWNGYTMHRQMNGQMRFVVGDATASATLVSTGTAPDNVWTHVACVYTGANKIIYLNGVSNTTIASTLNPGVWTFPELRVGLDDYDRGFYGNIDEVRLYGSALTAAEVLSIYNGVNPPTNLTATNGPNQVTLNWTAVTGATGYNILRSGTSGSGYVQIGSVTPGTTTTYIDSTALFPNTYYYVVQTVVNTLTSSYSSQVTGVPSQALVSISAPSGPATTEALGTVTFNVVFIAPNATNPTTITVTSNSPAEAYVSAPSQPTAVTPAASISFVVPMNTAPSIQIVVTGRPDQIDDGDKPFTVTIQSSSPTVGYTRTMTLNLTNIDIDTAGVTVTPSPGGFTVNEQGATSDTFTIRLNSIPIAPVTFMLTSSPVPTLPSQSVTINQASVTFPANASALTPVTITVTAIDDAAIELTQQYTIVIAQPVASADPLYAGMNPPDQVVTVLDNEAIPPLTKVWGCGFLGVEVLLTLGLAALFRRRRRSP